MIDRIVLVEPEHDVNVGGVARAMKNFGVKKLCLVRPKAKLGFEVTLYAKHSLDVIGKAGVFGSLDSAVKGCSLVIGTTGNLLKYRSRLKKCVTIRQAKKLVGGKDRCALVFGSEGSGLSKADLGKCDVLATIPTSREHGILNLSHAVAVCLYEFFKVDESEFVNAAGRAKVLESAKLFERISGKLGRLRDKQKVTSAFRQVLSRSRAADDEVNALNAFLGEVRKIVEEKKSVEEKTS
ncbi:hypothetical protein HY993_01990 [Candidatus Micrarchaeota archaeon]|nr:hypothetical protein [Candidatus Micrarchaeota archaeon]